MRLSKNALRTSLALAAFAIAAPASAASVVSTLLDYNGPENGPGSSFPIDLGIVGTFTFSLPSGATITSASIGGTYGTAALSTSTAGFDVSVDGTVVTACVPGAANCWVGGAPLRAFDIALPNSVFASLLDGSADLGIIQTNNTVVRYGTPTLTINFTTGVPEPATWGMMIAGFGIVGGTMRRRTRMRTSVRFA